MGKAFVNTWVTRYRIPTYIITDRGSQFKSKLFLKLLKIIAFPRLRMAVSHPQSNGLIKKAHWMIKSAIIVYKELWLKALLIVLSGIHSTPNESDFFPLYCNYWLLNINFKIIVDEADRETGTSDSYTFISKLHDIMSQFELSNFAVGHSHTNIKPFILNALMYCDKVWSRVDQVRKDMIVYRWLLLLVTCNHILDCLHSTNVVRVRDNYQLSSRGISPQVTPASHLKG